MSRNILCLVVDDSRTIRHVAANMLASLGFKVAEAEHGAAAVAFCSKTVPDFVLLDWNMPEMDGITCLRALRAMPLNPRPIVVMCTTENGLSKIQEALQAGAICEMIQIPAFLCRQTDLLTAAASSGRSGRQSPPP